MADQRLVDYLREHIDYPAEALAKVLLEHGYTPDQIAEAEAMLHAQHGHHEGYPADEPPDAENAPVPTKSRKNPFAAIGAALGNVPRGMYVGLFALVLVVSFAMGGWWYFNKPGEGLGLPGDIPAFDVSEPIKTDAPEEARHLSVVGSGPMEGDRMDCPGEGSFSYWQDDIAYIDGGYPVNRAYICRIDDTFAISVTAGGEMRLRDGRGVPDRLDVWLHVLEEDPVLLYSDDTPLMEGADTRYVINRISDAVIEIVERGKSGDADWRGGKVVHLGERRVVLDTNWYGNLVEIWRDGERYLVERMVDGCDADDLSLAPRILGISVAGDAVMEFDPPLIWEGGIADTAPCPPSPRFGEPMYDEFFSALELSFGQEGALLLDVNSLTGRFLLPDGSLGSKWATYDAAQSGFVMTYPSDWGLSAAGDGSFCFSDTTDTPTPASSDCLGWVGFRAPPPSVLSCNDYYLGHISAAPRALGDIDATQFSMRTCTDGVCGAEERYVVACRNDAVYEWALRDFSDSAVELFDEMLSRFRFTAPFTSISYPVTDTDPETSWEEWGSVTAGFHLRIPGEPTGNRCNPGSEAHFLCIADLSGNGNVYRFGGIHPWSGPYGGGEFSCGLDFDDCVANIRSGSDDAVITQKALTLSAGIHAEEVLIVETNGNETRWLIVEYTDSSGALVLWQDGLDSATNQIYSRIIGTITPW